jgi:DNA mismatch repair protein MutH
MSGAWGRTNKMVTVPYDKSSVQSIFEFALRLTGKTLAEMVSLPEGVTNKRNRGDLGTLIEKYYFEHQPPTNLGPDFPDANLELKTTGLLRNKQGKFKAKERLVLTMINYEVISEENWEKSYFLKKCKLMLILFYLYKKDIAVYDRKFVLKPLIYRMSDEDAIVIQRDWETIRQKVLDGKAHELSEGDTFYLGACRKGSGGENENLQKQPFSKELAKSRAFSFKQGYVNRLIDGHIDGEATLGITNSTSFEQATALRFNPFIGKTIEEISSAISFYKKGSNQKAFHRLMANRILSAGNQSIVEVEKAGIEIKTIRLKANRQPRESMSFPGFRTLEIVNQDWDESSFAEKLERKFLLVIFQTREDGVEVLYKVAYWNMPYQDRMEAKRVWEETKKRAAIDAKNLPGASESHVAHVRPKARDGEDKELTPQGEMVVKKCFWLNSGYIAQIVESL